jgi:predicted nucleic acid-binding protein
LSGRGLVLDTSAFLKLLVEEAETTALREWVTVETALAAISLVLPATTTFFSAGHLDSPELRSLDALHLAAAQELGDDLEGVVSYDARMIAGANALQIAVVSPRKSVAERG